MVVRFCKKAEYRQPRLVVVTIPRRWRQNRFAFGGQHITLADITIQEKARLVQVAVLLRVVNPQEILLSM